MKIDQLEIRRGDVSIRFEGANCDNSAVQELLQTHFGIVRSVVLELDTTEKSATDFAQMLKLASPWRGPDAKTHEDWFVILASKCAAYEISVRSANVLNGTFERWGSLCRPIHFTWQLCVCTERELRQRRNCGRATIKELKGILASLGLSFGMSPNLLKEQLGSRLYAMLPVT